MIVRYWIYRQDHTGRGRCAAGPFHYGPRAQQVMDNLKREEREAKAERLTPEGRAVNVHYLVGEFDDGTFTTSSRDLP